MGKAEEQDLQRGMSGRRRRIWKCKRWI